MYLVIITIMMMTMIIISSVFYCHWRYPLRNESIVEACAAVSTQQLQHYFSAKPKLLNVSTFPDYMVLSYLASYWFDCLYRLPASVIRWSLSLEISREIFWKKTSQPKMTRAADSRERWNILYPVYSDSSAVSFCIVACQCVHNASIYRI